MVKGVISKITITTEGRGVWHYQLFHRVATDGHETELYRSKSGSGTLALCMSEARMFAEACDNYGPATIPSVRQKAG